MSVCRRVEQLGKIEDVAHACGAKAINRLRIVPDHGETFAVRFQAAQDRGLQRVGVLVLVDEDMVEEGADVVGQCRHLHQLAPIEQEVVVIEHVLLLLGLDIGIEQSAQIAFPFGAPGKLLGKDDIEGFGGVDGARVDGKAGGFERKPLGLFRQALLVAHEV